MWTIDTYQKFDFEIFEVTKILVGCSLSDGQKDELLKLFYEIEAAYRDGSLNADERQRLLLSMADCGMELPLAPTETGINESELSMSVWGRACPAAGGAAKRKPKTRGDAR